MWILISILYGIFLGEFLWQITRPEPTVRYIYFGGRIYHYFTH